MEHKVHWASEGPNPLQLRQARAVELYRTGASLDQVAAELEISEGSVRNWLKKANVAPRRRGRPRLG
jgi:transposase